MRVLFSGNESYHSSFLKNSTRVMASGDFSCSFVLWILSANPGENREQFYVPEKRDEKGEAGGPAGVGCEGREPAVPRARKLCPHDGCHVPEPQLAAASPGWTQRV